MMNKMNEKWKQGWHIIGGQRCYFRSKWEVNYAHYLEWLKNLGEINYWEYEPYTFWFDGIKRGVRSYKPDYLVVENDGSRHYIELKGYMDKKSATKLKRMKTYHPEIDMRLVDSAAYRNLAKQIGSTVPGWE